MEGGGSTIPYNNPHTLKAPDTKAIADLIKKSGVKLTDNVVQHYSEGKSFEDNHMNRCNSNIAIVISIEFYYILALPAT